VRHGSSYGCDAAGQIRDLISVMRDVRGPKADHCETTAMGTISRGADDGS